MYEMEILIIIDKDLVTYEYDSFARGFHVYMDIWNPVIGEILKRKRDPTNEVVKHAVAIMCSDSLGKESVVGHIPHNISKFSSMFLTIPSTAIEVEVLGKRVNREISVLWPRKTHPMVDQKIGSSKKRTRM